MIATARGQGIGGVGAHAAENGAASGSANGSESGSVVRESGNGNARGSGSGKGRYVRGGMALVYLSGGGWRNIAGAMHRACIWCVLVLAALGGRGCRFGPRYCCSRLVLLFYDVIPGMPVSLQRQRREREKQEQRERERERERRRVDSRERRRSPSRCVHPPNSAVCQHGSTSSCVLCAQGKAIYPPEHISGYPRPRLTSDTLNSRFQPVATAFTRLQASVFPCPCLCLGP
jgi:hypothetical protein